MCGRYSVLTEDEVIEVRKIINDISLRLARDEFENYEEAQQETMPTDRAPIVTSNGDELAFELVQFGFENYTSKGVIINARAETVTEKSTFKRHIQNGRCIVPASGYFEWKTPVEGQKKKIKHMIKDEQGSLLFMAGLWRDGKDGREFVIITNEPVGVIIDIHDRMPVILRIDQLEAWLSGAMPIKELASTEYDCSGVPCEEPEESAAEIGQIRLF